MKRNLGWGRTPRCALEQAVLRQYGPGKLATRRVTVARAVRVFAEAGLRYGERTWDSSSAGMSQPSCARVSPLGQVRVAYEALP